MNALLLIGIIFALSGFKPKEETRVGTGNETSDGDSGQITQGYYTPFGDPSLKGKMDSNAPVSVSTDEQGRPKMNIEGVPVGTYFVGWSARFEGGKLVEYTLPHLAFRKGAVSSGSFGEYNPMNYTTE